ncbi:MAG: DMT family transporter [Bauldia sp.]|nr:DMT family transporter [Bauldia sp.]
MNLFSSLARRLYGQPYLLLSLTSLFWAINLVLARFVAGRVPPLFLSQVRWTGALLILLPFAWSYLKRDWPVIRRHLPVLTVISLMGITAYNSIAYYGLTYTDAINGLLTQSAAPLLIGLWSLLLFRDRLTPAQLVGILVSFVGVTIIVSRGSLETLAHLTLNPGDILMVIAIATYSLYSALLRLRPPVHWLSFLTITIALGQAMIVPFFLVELALGARVELSPAAWWTMAYVILIPSIFAPIFFNRGVELIGANRAGPFFHLIPVFGSALAIAFLGERPQVFHGIGYGLIVVGIVIAQRGRKPDVAATPADTSSEPYPHNRAN